jgi:hypothetical protein
LLFLSRVGIDSITDILGHSETRTTLRYPGIRLDDQKRALASRDDYLKQIETDMMQNTGEEKG